MLDVFSQFGLLPSAILAGFGLRCGMRAFDGLVAIIIRITEF